MGYSLFLDDMRHPTSVRNDGADWVWVKSAAEFMETIDKMGIPKRVSLDYDLDLAHYGYPNRRDNCGVPDGLDCMKYLAGACRRVGLCPIPFAFILRMSMGVEK